MRLLFEVAKEFKGLLTLCLMGGFALAFWHIGAKEIAVAFSGGSLTHLTPELRERKNQPPK